MCLGLVDVYFVPPEAHMKPQVDRVHAVLCCDVLCSSSQGTQNSPDFICCRFFPNLASFPWLQGASYELLIEDKVDRGGPGLETEDSE